MDVDAHKETDQDRSSILRISTRTSLADTPDLVVDDLDARDEVLMGMKWDRLVVEGCAASRVVPTLRRKTVTANDNVPFVAEMRLAA